MFRESRRAKQNLDKEQCVKLLKEERRGVLGMLGDEDYPYALPINFYYDEEENKIYFHCGPKGHKMDAMKKHDKVSFTVWNQGIQKKDWSYYVDCVVIFGRVHFLEDRDVCREKLRDFGRKYIRRKMKWRMNLINTLPGRKWDALPLTICPANWFMKSRGER